MAISDSGQIVMDDTTGIYVFQIVPEPSTVALVVLGGLLGVVMLRRRRRPAR